MKKYLLSLSLLALITTTAFAGNDKKMAAVTPEQRVDYSIQNQISVPKALVEAPGEYTAEMHFHVSPQGSILINEIISDNDDLKASLMNQAHDISVDTNGLDTQSGYKMTIKFKIVESN